MKVPRLELEICRLRRDRGVLEVTVMKKMCRICDLKADCALATKKAIVMKLKVNKKRLLKLRRAVHEAREHHGIARVFGNNGFR